MTPSRENKEKGVKIVWFGVSERGPKLKTTLHGDLLLMVDNIRFTARYPLPDQQRKRHFQNYD